MKYFNFLSAICFTFSTFIQKRINRYARKITILFAALVFLAGCANYGDQAVLNIHLKDIPAAKAEAGSIIDRLLKFFRTEAYAQVPGDVTSINIRISGPGMSVINVTVPATEDYVELSVPAGKSRVIEIRAIEEHEAAYGYTTTMDLSAGERKEIQAQMTGIPFDLDFIYEEWEFFLKWSVKGSVDYQFIVERASVSAGFSEIDTGEIQDFNGEYRLPVSDMSGKYRIKVSVEPDTSLYSAVFPDRIDSEGSVDNPVNISLNSRHIGRVGRDTSYYKASFTGADFQTISIMNLTDDADLLRILSEGGFETEDREIEELRMNYIGGNMNETISVGWSEIGDYIFAVDGAHTGKGAYFMIYCEAHGGADAFTPVSSIENPFSLRVSHLSALYNLSGDNADSHFFTSTLETGREYWLNIYENTDPITTNIFSDPAFENPIEISGTGGFTPQQSSIYVEVSGEQGDRFRLEITASEGSIANPIELYADEIFGVGRANYRMVGGSGSSYYRIPVSKAYPDGAYAIKVVPQTSDSGSMGDVDLYVYDNSSFSNLVDSSTEEGDNISESVLYAPFPDNNIYIEVRDMTGSGATFILSVSIEPLPL